MTKEPPIPPDSIARYDRIILSIPGIVRKGKMGAYTSLNGHMFSFLTAEGNLALRLPRTEREAFHKKHADSVCVQYGAVMKEYVVVPDALFKRTAAIKKLFALSHAYVGSLKPKPTTRKAAKKNSK